MAQHWTSGATPTTRPRTGAEGAADGLVSSRQGHPVHSQYVVICTGGLEFVTCEEAERTLQLACAPRILPRGESDGHAGCGKVLLTTTSACIEICSLRSAHSLIAFAGHISSLRSDREDGLADARAAIETAGWTDALALWRAHRQLMQPAVPVPECPAFRASSVRDGSHAFTSPELARVLGGCIWSQFQFPVNLVAFELEALVIAHDSELTMGISLSFERTWRNAGLPPDARPLMPYCIDRLYSLRPSVAWTLGQLARPTKADSVLVDSMAGIGTVPIELFAQWPSVLCLSGDSSMNALESASPNVQYARALLTEGTVPPGPRGWAEKRRAPAERERPLPARRGERGTCECLRWDASSLPLRLGCVDVAVVDLPFGERCGNKGQLGRLYSAALAQLARALRTGGRAVLLTLEADELRKAVGSRPELWRICTLHERVHIGSYARCIVAVLERSEAVEGC